MTSRRAREVLARHYAGLLPGVPVTSPGDYEGLVTPTGNSAEPIHRWAHVKEAYSHRLLERVLKDTNQAAGQSLAIVDPFAGSGTTALATVDLVRSGTLPSAQVLSAEVNPYLHLVASAKLRASIEGAPGFLKCAKAVAAIAQRDHRTREVPGLSTFSRAEYFSSANVQRLLTIRAAIDSLATDESPEAISLARVCLAGAVEPASSLRKDGRALRFVPAKVPTDPLERFLDLAFEIDEDLPAVAVPVVGGVVLADSRSGDWLPRDSSFDLALFSPPYPNNIDYTEVYKLEAWMLGLLDDDSGFAAQRRQTIRSHPSLHFGDVYSYVSGGAEQEKHMNALLAPLIAAIPDGRYRMARERVIRGYFDDMYLVLRNLLVCLRPGADVVFVVGNSLHGGQGEEGLLIASDILLSVVAEIVGFKTERIAIGRHLGSRRNGSDPLHRESVVFLKRAKV